MQLTKVIDNVVVSSLIMYYVELPSRKLCVIEEVWTHEDHRKKGYATELMHEAIYKAIELGADCIELTVRQDSPHIQEFYKSLGFEDRKNIAMRLTVNPSWSRG